MIRQNKNLFAEEMKMGVAHVSACGFGVEIVNHLYHSIRLNAFGEVTFENTFINKTLER